MALTIYSTTWCGPCQRLKAQIARAGIPYTEIDIEDHPDGAELVMEINGGSQTVPTVVFADGSTMTNPSLIEVQSHLTSLAATWT